MTTDQIEAKKAKEMLIFETAKKVRRVLDEARQQYGESAWDGDDKEEEVLELVTSDP